MKNLPYFFLAALVLVGGFIAYSRQQTNEPIVATPLQLQHETPDSTQTNVAILPIKDTLVLEKEAEALLTKYDLSRLWTEKPDYTYARLPIYLEIELEIVNKNGDTIEPVTRVNNVDSLDNTNSPEEVTVHKRQPETDASIYNGFYGTDRYRIEMYFASVTKDSKRPNVYLVKGKSRFKKNITPFSGEIVLNEVQTLRDHSVSKKELKLRKVSNLYATSGTFEFREDSTHSSAGVFLGKVYLDFATYTNQTNRLWFHSEKNKTKGAGFLFDGQWISYKSGESKPIILPNNVFIIASTLLKNFEVGGRSVEINPRYRKLGWENFWENEEWWNEPSKPIL